MGTVYCESCRKPIEIKDEIKYKPYGWFCDDCYIYGSIISSVRNSILSKLKKLIKFLKEES
jgi:hypothetical protein